MHYIKLVNMGIQPEPECLVISKEFGHKKPDPEIFTEALRRLGGPQPSETLFVGDNPRMDVHGASNAGLVTAWMRRGRKWKWGSPEPVIPLIGHIGNRMRDHIPTGLAEYADGARHMISRRNQKPFFAGRRRNQTVGIDRIFMGIAGLIFIDHAAGFDAERVE